MDTHKEAQEASRSEIRGDCEEEELQAKSAEKQDLQSKITTSELVTLSSEEEEEEAAVLDCTVENVKISSCELGRNKVFLNGIDSSKTASKKSTILVDDANLEVSELIKEILSESSSFLEGEGMNGVDASDFVDLTRNSDNGIIDNDGVDGRDFVDLTQNNSDNGLTDIDRVDDGEFIDGLTQNSDNGITDNDVPLYFENSEGRSSTPDSDSNMRTASEGSSTPTSQLSAPSSHSSVDHKDILIGKDTENPVKKEEVDFVSLENNSLDVKKEILKGEATENKMKKEKLVSLDQNDSNKALETKEESIVSAEYKSVNILTGKDNVENVLKKEEENIVSLERNSLDVQEEILVGKDIPLKKEEKDLVDLVKKEEKDFVWKNNVDCNLKQILNDERVDVESEVSNVTEALENVSLSGLKQMNSNDAGNFVPSTSDISKEELTTDSHEENTESIAVCDLEGVGKLQKEAGNIVPSPLTISTGELSAISPDSHKENIAAEENVLETSNEEEQEEISHCTNDGEGDKTTIDSACRVTVEEGNKMVKDSSLAANDSSTAKKDTTSLTEKDATFPTENNTACQAEKDTTSSTAVSSDCVCKSRLSGVEEGGSVMVGVWGELRSSLRQLHRSVIPQSSQTSSHRSRPSLTRIKALANMLVTHDAHQFYHRLSHLAHELCIELKVRLLATIHDNPTVEEASTFIQGVCDSYQWVMSVCEAVHPALERLDSEHLARFKLNWVTVNMHIFYATILTDPDVQDYAHMCKCKVSESSEGDNVIGCLASLHRTLAVAEAVWVRADALLQDYAVERAALTNRRRQLLADWEHFKAHHHNHHHDIQNSTVSSATGDEVGGQCPCDECVVVGKASTLDPQSFSSSSRSIPTSAEPCPPSTCECHYCNASSSTTGVEEPVLAVSSSSGSLPPLAQPQLSLYPHIHNTPPGSDIVGGGSQTRDDVTPGPPPVSTKPPITTNPYVGSDVLTEQLMREWEMMYGDALTPPGSHPILPPSESSLPQYESDPSSLVSGVESLHLDSSPRPSYTRTMLDPALPYAVQEPRTSIHTVPHSSHSTTSTAKSQQLPITRTSTSTLSMPEETLGTSSQCCAGGTTTSVITHTRAHHPHKPHTGKCMNAEMHKHVERIDRSTSRESDSESSREGEEWSSGDESDSSTTVSSTHQDPHCDCCYCHMLHHNQGGGRQKYSDRRDRLLQILSRKKKARSTALSSGSSTSTSTNCTSHGGIPTAAVKGGQPVGGQNIDDILDFIEGNHMDEEKHAKKVAKKARQKQKKMAVQREEEKNEDDGNTYSDKNNYDDDLDDVEEDGPLAELRRRAPDVTITVVRPGQQPPRTPPTSQLSNHHPSEQVQNSMERNKLPSAKLVPSLAQTPPEPGHQSRPGSRTILHPFRQSNQSGRSSQPQPKHTDQPTQLPVNTGFPNNPQESIKSGSGVSSLSNILKGMDTTAKEKDKGSQMVTIRRVMDPNNAEPTVTITLKGEQPEKDKVLFKLVNGQAVSGTNGGRPSQSSKKGGGGSNQSKAQFQAQPQPQHVPEPVPEGLNPEEAKKYKKRQKKERQRLKKQQEQIEEQQKGQIQQIELQKQQEFLRLQQEQIFQQQMALQRQQEELLKQQQQQQNTQSNTSKKNKKSKKTSKVVKNVTSTSTNKNCGNKTSGSSKGVSAVVYDGDDMAQNFNLPPGVTINRVEGQPGMVTISNNMGGAFSQPFLPNPNIYPSPIMHGFPTAQETSLPKPYGRTPGLSWNSTIDNAGNYPDKDVIVVDTNNGYIPSSGTNNGYASASSVSSNSSAKRELTSDEKVLMAVKGLIDPGTLNMTQKKKFKKKKKELQEEKEKEEQKQREEDDLMDQMYNLAKGKISKQTTSTVYAPNNKNPRKKDPKQKETSKTQATQNTTSKQTVTKNSKQQQKTQEISMKQKHQEASKQNVKNVKQGTKETNNLATQSGKASMASNQNAKVKQPQGKVKQPSQNSRQSTQVQPPQKLDSSKQVVQQKQLKGSMPQQTKQTSQQKPPQKSGSVIHGNQKQISSQQKQNQIQSKQSQPQLKNNQKHEQQKQNQQLKQQGSQVQHKQQQQQQKQPQSERHSKSVTNCHKANVSNGGKVNYVPQDIAHEARYAQYLVANADTLVKMNYSPNSNVPGDQNTNQPSIDEEKKGSKKKRAKKSRRGNLEDMTTIDSVFTPKDVAEGELDETERDVEAFKRFCFNNVPLHSGEKPKVNFNVKDIMIKKRPCNVNL